MRKVIGFLFLLFVGNSVFANPTAFGLTIGKTTETEAKKIYHMSADGKYFYHVDISRINLDGLMGLDLLFDEKNVLLGVFATFNRGKKDEIFRSLSEKYRLIEKDMPFVGSAYAKFSDGESSIILNAPHLSFEMTVSYAHNSLMEAVREHQEQENQNKKNKMDSLL